MINSKTNMTVESALTNSYFYSSYSVQTDTSPSTDSSSVFSMYSPQKHPSSSKIKVKSSKMSTTSKWLASKLRSTTTKSVKQPTRSATKRFSLRLAESSSPTCHYSACEQTYGIDALFNVDKNLTTKYRSTLLKLMDKPLGWLRIKPKTTTTITTNNNKKTNLRRKSTTNFKSASQHKHAVILPNKSQIVNLNFLMSAPSMSSSLNYEASNIMQVSNNTCSQQRNLHSTPQSQVYNQFSPISVWNSSSHSTPRSSTPSSLLISTPKSPLSNFLKTNKSTLSATPSISRRLSFGITSSPKPLHQVLNSLQCPEYFVNSTQCRECLECESFYTREHQEQLIAHLNTIKHSVKMGVAFRNESNQKNDLFRKETRKKIFKCKKLQKMFQMKIRKQIKDTRKC